MSTTHTDGADQVREADTREGDRRAPGQAAAEDTLLVREAVSAAKKEIGDHEPGMVYEGKVQGRAGEIVAHEGHPRTLDLNDGCVHNYPVYDLVGQREGFISVKTHVNRPDGSVPVESYAHDLRVAIGATWRPREGLAAGKNGPDFAAERLWRIREEDPRAWDELSRKLPPAACETRSPRQLAAVMQESAQLAVPADHLKPAREYVERVAQLHPEKYGIDPTSSEAEIRQAAHDLSRRIVSEKPGVTSTMIARQVARATAHRGG